VRPRALAVALVVALLAALVVLPIVLIDPLGARGGHVRHFTAFATNMALLRFYAYAVDRWRGRAGPEPLRGFLLAMFFFPTFVNGPIETPRDMRAGWLPPAPDAQRAGAGGGLGRGAGGVAKLLVAGLAFPPGWTSSALGAGAAAPAGQLWLWGALLYGWFYLSFAAWTDVAVGLGRLCGRRVQENFAHPWAAVDPADFWRRWHLSFGLWLRDYVYIPLGGNRRRRALNVLATFLVSAAWHIWGSVKFLGLGFFGPHAWEGFLFWGLLNAAGVLAARPMARAVRAGGAWGVGVGRVATFAFAAWCWIPFFLPPGVAARDCLAMLRRMVWPF
jgi:D-alanyl-lipoteichoic acid acyltransferase DltB (MBOAT superfamily)